VVIRWFEYGLDLIFANSQQLKTKNPSHFAKSQQPKANSCFCKNCRKDKKQQNFL
jgi:hypothetical protein